MTLSAADLATFDEAKEVLQGVFDKLRKGTSDKELPELKKCDELLCGWLPTLGRISKAAQDEARGLKVAAENRRASEYRRMVKEGKLGERACDHAAAMDEKRQELLYEWAKTKGRAEEMTALREDCLETLRGVKSAMEADVAMGGRK